MAVPVTREFQTSISGCRQRPQKFNTNLRYREYIIEPITHSMCSNRGLYLRGFINTKPAAGPIKRHIGIFNMNGAVCSIQYVYEHQPMIIGRSLAYSDFEQEWNYE